MSGTVRTAAYLLNQLRPGQVSARQDPVDMQDFVATVAAMAGGGQTLAAYTAGGTTQATATQLTTYNSSVTSVPTLGNGVILMTWTNAPLVDQKVSNDALLYLCVWPPTGVSIGSRPANQPILVPPGGFITLRVTSATTCKEISGTQSPCPLILSSASGLFRRPDPPWVDKLKNNTDVADRSAALATLPTTVPKPAYLQSVTDPYYGTQITRISGDPGTSIRNTTGLWSTVSRHHYSSDQSWNCDESLLYIGYNYDPNSSFMTSTLATSTTVSSGTTLTFASGPSSAALAVGSYVIGTGVPVGAKVLSINTGTHTITLSQTIIATCSSGTTITFVYPTFTVLWTSTTVSSGSTLTFAAPPSGSNVVVNAPVTGVAGSNVPAASLVASISGNTIVLSTTISSSIPSGTAIIFGDPAYASFYQPVILDGQTYVPLFQRTPPGQADVHWHPTNPHLMIQVDASVITTWDVTTGASVTLVTLTGYTGCTMSFHANSTVPGNEGNPIVPVLGTRTSDSKVVAFSYDLNASLKSADIVQPAGSTWASVFPSNDGTYLVINDTGATNGGDALIVFNRSTGAQVGSPVNNRISEPDITIDQSGAIVMIGVDKGGGQPGRIGKVNVATQAITDFSPTSPASFGSHTSCQAFQYQGWALVTYYGHNDQTDAYPLYLGELVAMRADGSAPFRLCHHFSWNSGADYYAQVQASWSPSGTRLIWNSNWGDPNGNTRPMQTYVCDLRPFLTFTS